MNYTTVLTRKRIENNKSRRQKAVYLAGRIKKANASPGFNWEKAIAGFSGQFKKEANEAQNESKHNYPEHPEDPIEWIHLIIYFADQPYKQEKI